MLSELGSWCFTYKSGPMFSDLMKQRSVGVIHNTDLKLQELVFPPALEDLFFEFRVKQTEVFKVPDTVFSFGLAGRFTPELVHLPEGLMFFSVDLVEPVDLSKLKLPSTLKRFVVTVPTRISRSSLNAPQGVVFRSC